MNCRLVYRDQSLIILKNPFGEEEIYNILLDFPFTSESKRMGIILKHAKSSKTLFYIKGAEQAIAEKVSLDSAGKIKEAAENLSIEGLRTLAFASKELDEADYLNWKEAYDRACASEDQREKKKMVLREQLETNMEYLGVTGVEGYLSLVNLFRYFAG